MEAISPATKDPVFELIDRCCEAWKKCDEASEQAQGGASHNDVTKLINSHTDVEQARPKTIAGFIAKWRHVIKYARALEVNTREKCLDDMETMLHELTELVGARG
jgi:ABC-type nitrate/sulfonate/bicarbonate transport system substrate-binding protein